MRRYIATLHTKPDKHKKRFALLVSGGFTASLFAVWSLVNFGLPIPLDSSAGELASRDRKELREVAEVTPFDSLRGGVAAAFKALGGSLGELKTGLERVDFNGEYEEIRGRALEYYGR